MKSASLLSALACLLLVACSHNETTPTREISARPRVEQRALSNAIDDAFKSVDFGLVNGKKVYVEIQALSKLDIEFIKAYINGLIIRNGGIVVKNESSSEIKIHSIVKISGTDEIRRTILRDKVRGEFSCVLSISDLKLNKVLRTYELSGESDETR